MIGVGVGIIQVHTADLYTRTHEDPPPYLLQLKVREWVIGPLHFLHSFLLPSLLSHIYTVVFAQQPHTTTRSTMGNFAANEGLSTFVIVSMFVIWRPVFFSLFCFLFPALKFNHFDSIFWLKVHRLDRIFHKTVFWWMNMKQNLFLWLL